MQPQRDRCHKSGRRTATDESTSFLSAPQCLGPLAVLDVLLLDDHVLNDAAATVAAGAR
jgi:hypothetical protein